MKASSPQNPNHDSALAVSFQRRNEKKECWNQGNETKDLRAWRLFAAGP
jgi:hypothetical protein